jgi:hypothetical protein
MRIRKSFSIAAGLALAIPMGAALGAPFASTRDAASAAPTIGGWAVVNANGKLAFGKNVARSAILGDEGFYTVTFKTNIRHCAYIISTGLSDGTGTPPPAYAAANSSSSSDRQVFVETFNSSGENANEGFHIAVMC